MLEKCSQKETFTHRNGICEKRNSKAIVAIKSTASSLT